MIRTATTNNLSIGFAGLRSPRFLHDRLSAVHPFQAECLQFAVTDEAGDTEQNKRQDN
jgi:hypothetical protein